MVLFTSMFLIVIFILLIYINYLIANNFYNIAKTKGFNNKKYFWFCFWLGIVGYLMVIALPNQYSNIPRERIYTESEREN